MKFEDKPVIIPGYVISQSDGDSHYVGFAKLCELYGLLTDEAIHVDRTRGMDISDHHKLRARSDGQYFDYKERYTLPRGTTAKDGDTYVSANGYHYTKKGGKFRLTHHIIAEDNLGRPIKEDERVAFADGNRKNLDPDNIVVKKKGSGSLHRQKSRLEAHIAELQAQLDDVNDRLQRGYS